MNLTPTLIAPGESTYGTGQYVVTQSDIDASEIVNTATTTGYYLSNATVTAVASVIVTVDQTPSLTLNKSASSTSVSQADEVICYY